MKIAIIGAGALGSLFGGLLVRSGEEVHLFDPIAKEHIAAINAAGLVIEEAGEMIRVAVRATTSIEEVGQAELVALFVKAPQTEAAIRGALPAIGPSTLVLSLQNGLGLEELMEKYLPKSRLLRGVTAQGSTLLGPGRVRHAGRGPTWLGPLGQVGRERLEGIVRAFNRARIETYLELDIARLVWKKLLINAGINALTAIFGVPNGKLVEDPELNAIMRGALAEAVEVARAQGLEFRLPEVVAEVEEVCRLTAANLSSMLQDVRRGSETEIDYINGAVVRLGEERGLPTPLNRLLVRLVKEGGKPR
ncbi:MAG: 2-dehydropantoate 2-reductase [Candidatus Acetothermia bacterium]|nr:2-dehydropantoate 2-reductase [Candidatus Acetothermia bacterium]MDH7504817.1 2-dehydropantoate 2-reductase [Candidatus Acetothermia bacterium]